MSGALSHLRVLDLSRILAGPWCSQLLGDLGAEVIKVERPGSGDDTRAWGPPFVRDLATDENSDAAYFMCANRNKSSVTIDFTQPAGQELIRSLVAQCDVLVENFKVGGLKAYGLDYDTLKKVNPRLIYCSITGFGQTGPYAARPGYDFLIQAMGGLMSLTGRKAGEAGAGPQKVGVALTDILTGLYGTVGILAALTHLEKTGVGQHVDMALLDVQVACLANQSMNYLVGGVSPTAMGNLHPNIVPYQDFPTADGHMILAVGNDGQFSRLCEVLGGPTLGTSDRYKSNQARVANRVELVAILGTLTVRKTTAEWVSLLEQAKVPCGPINDLKAVFADEQVISRGLRIDLPHPSSGAVPSVANPIRLSETPVSYRSAPPRLGAQTAEVLSKILGIDAAQLARLAGQKII